MRKRKRLLVPEPLEGVIERSGEDRFAPSRPPIPARVWRDAVGARIADRSQPVFLDRGVLLVRAATSVWANELSLLSDPILLRLRERGFVVQELRFRVGPLEPPARPPERRVSRAVPPPAALPAELTSNLRAVGDPELREVIALAARANLAWQDYVAEPPARDGGARAEVSAAPPAAPTPRAAGRGSDRPDRRPGACPEAPRCTPEGGRGRPR